MKWLDHIPRQMVQPGMSFKGGGFVAANGADGKTFLFFIPRHAVISFSGNLSIK